MSASLTLARHAVANSPGPVVGAVTASGSAPLVDAGDGQGNQPSFGVVLQQLVKALGTQSGASLPGVPGLAIATPVGTSDLAAMLAQLATKTTSASDTAATPDPALAGVVAPAVASDLAALLAQLASPPQQQVITAVSGEFNALAVMRKENRKAGDDADIANASGVAASGTASPSISADALAAQATLIAAPIAAAAQVAGFSQAKADTVNPGQRSLGTETPTPPATIAAAASTLAAINAQTAQASSNIDHDNAFATTLLHAEGEDAAAALAATQASANAETAKNAATALHNSAPALVVSTPVGNAGWTGEIADKLTWMVGHQEQRVELVLNPPQLGRVEVSLSLNGDQATAQFLSTNPVVREALDSAMPRLREMLADGGITLGQTHVGSDSAGQSANQRENSDNSTSFHTGSILLDAAGQPGGAATQWLGLGRGLVDVFA